MAIPGLTMISSVRAWVMTRVPIVLVALALLGFGFWAVDPMPPRRVVLATGAEGSSYDLLGQRYRNVLRRHGITVELRRSEGARGNAELLLDGASGVDMGFVRGAAFSDDEREEAELVSLGSLFYEPVWLFHRTSLKLQSLGGLAGRKVNIGQAGSGTSHLVEELLRQNNLSLADIDGLGLDNSEAVGELLHKDIDAVFLTSGSNAPLVQMLLRTPGIALFDFTQAQAYSRRLPTLAAVTLPRGVVDLVADIPPLDKQLLAPVVTLAMRDDIHPSIADLMVQAAAEIHTKGDWFARPGQFPSADAVGFPLAREAQRFYRNGPPLLQRYLPFWLANLIERMWVVLLSIAALLIPLSKILPPLYAWRMRSRIYRWYGELKAVEYDAMQAGGSTAGAAGAGVADGAARLDALEAQVNAIVVPLSYTDEVYFLRQHIEMVRQRLMTRVPVSPA